MKSNESKEPSPLPWFKDGQELVVLSLNMEYFHKYCAAKDKAAYHQYLSKKLNGVDVLCVQEDLLFWSDKFLGKGLPFHGFNRIVSSTTQLGIKHSKLKDMVYEDKGTMETMKKNGMKEQEFSSILGNSIYLSKSSAWEMTDSKVVQTSTKMMLPSGKPLGYRSVVCATLNHAETERPVQVLCTHLSGGRFEDAYMIGSMRDERANQIKKGLKQKDDSADNVLMGDFNASVTRTQALDGYLEMLRKGDQPELSTSDYYSYMMAPFTSISSDKKKNWSLLYKTLDGPTSAFGHEIDFYITSSHMHVQTPFNESPKIERIRMIKSYMPWIKPTADEDFKSTDDKDVDEADVDASDVLKEPITDHNGVKVTFFQPRKYVIAAEITFNVVEGVTDADWYNAFKCGQISKLINEIADMRMSVTSRTVYPVIEHADTVDGPDLLQEASLAAQITHAQKDAWEFFSKKPTFATFETFMRECADVERKLLTDHGWWVDDEWYSIKKVQNSLQFEEKMTAAHKQLHGDVLSVLVLRELLKKKILSR